MPLNLLALDPSTGEKDSPLGAALFFDVPRRGDIPLPLVWAKSAEWVGAGRPEESEQDALQRCYVLGDALGRWFAEEVSLCPTWDASNVALAWEAPFLHPSAGLSNVRTYGTLMVSVGVYFSICNSVIGCRPLYPIRPQEAATVYGGGKMKRAEKKLACQKWALAYWGEPGGRRIIDWQSETGKIGHTKEQIEAISDACSVGVKAIEQWRESLLSPQAKAAGWRA